MSTMFVPLLFFSLVCVPSNAVPVKSIIAHVARPSFSAVEEGREPSPSSEPFMPAASPEILPGLTWIPVTSTSTEAHSSETTVSHSATAPQETARKSAGHRKDAAHTTKNLKKKRAMSGPGIVQRAPPPPPPKRRKTPHLTALQLTNGPSLVKPLKTPVPLPTSKKQSPTTPRFTTSPPPLTNAQFRNNPAEGLTSPPKTTTEHHKNPRTVPPPQGTTNIHGTTTRPTASLSRQKSSTSSSANPPHKIGPSMVSTNMGSSRLELTPVQARAAALCIKFSSKCTASCAKASKVCSPGIWTSSQPAGYVAASFAFCANVDCERASRICSRTAIQKNC